MKKKQLFSLRKLTVGIASVSLGSVVFLGGAQNAQAETTSNDPAVQKQIELAQKVAAEQAQQAQDQKAVDKQVELAKKANAEQAQIEAAKKAAAEQVAKGQAEVNKLENISKETKAQYNDKIAKAATADIPAIVKDAKAVDAQVATAKNVANEQKQIELAKKANAEQAQIETAKKVAAEQVAKGQAEVNKLTNISKETKAIYNSKIANAAVADIPAIIKDAKAVDAQVATAKNVAKEQAAAKDKAVKALNQKTADAYQVINSLKNITDKQQLSFLHQVEVDSGTNNGERIDAIVADAKQLDAQFAYDKEQKAKAEQKSARELNTLTQVAYNTVNGLHNLTDQQKDAFNKQILHDSGNNNGHNLNNIVANAKSLDEQNGNAKHAREAGASTVAQKDKAVRELNTLTSVAYNTVNGLHNLTDEQKEDFNYQILVDSGNNNGQKINDIVAAAKQKDAQNAQANHVREEGANTNLPADVAKKVKEAHNTVDALKNLKAEQKTAAHRKLNEVARKDAKAIDTVVSQAKELDAKQAPAKNVGAKKEIELAQKAHADQIKKAQAEVNKLENISKETKAEFNKKIAQAATDEVVALVKDAQAVDAQVATAKNVANEQAANTKKQITTAQKAHAQQIAQAQALVNKLENLSKDAKEQYNQKIAQAATNEVEAIVKKAQAQDKYAANAKKQITTTQKAHAQQIAQAQAVVNKLENLSKDAKEQYNKKIAQAATNEVEAIVKKAQAENAKQVPAKKVVKDSVQNNKEPKAVNNNAKAVTGQKESKATTASNKANAQQKAKDAKKQLPATGEQDQVLFGLLSGSLFASAGTLFLLNARRRKENE